MDNKLQEFIELTAAILDIDDYEIRVDQENQLDKTTKAGYVFGTSTILINEGLAEESCENSGAPQGREADRLKKIRSHP